MHVRIRRAWKKSPTLGTNSRSGRVSLVTSLRDVTRDSPQTRPRRSWAVRTGICRGWRPPLASTHGRRLARAVPRRPQPRPAGGRPHDRGAAARHRRRRLRQDPRPHPPRRAPDRRARREAERDPRDHLHEQGRGRDARAPRAAARRRGRAAIWILTFHAACGRILRREAERLGYRSNFTIYDQADQVRLVKAVPGGAGARPEALHPARHPRPDLEREEPARRPRRVREPGRSRSTTRRSPRSTSCTSGGCFASNAVDFDDLLMLTVDVLERFPEAREQLAAGVPLRPRRRVPGHEPRAVPAAAAARRRSTGTCCAVGDPDQSIYAFSGADIRNILDFERDFPGTRDDRARAELPLDELDPRAPRTRVIANNRERKPKDLWSELGDGEPVRVHRGRGRARRGALRRGRDRAARRGGLLRARDRGLLPDERAVARARGRARPPGRPVPGDRRPALLRARRDQGRDRLPPGDRQPGRRGLAACGSPTGRGAGSATRSLARLQTLGRRAGHARSARRSAHAEEAGVGAAPLQGGAADSGR